MYFRGSQMRFAVSALFTLLLLLSGSLFAQQENNPRMFVFQQNSRINLGEKIPSFHQPLFQPPVLPSLTMPSLSMFKTGEMRPVRIGSLTIWSESYHHRSVLPRQPFYEMYWLFFKPSTPKIPFAVGAVAVRNGDINYVGLGLRLSLH